MRFASPWFLILLLLIPLILWRGYRISQGRLKFSSLSVLLSLRYSTLNPRFLLMGFRGLALAFLVLALARPQSGKRFTEVSSNGVDIMLAMDTSGSMQALDLKIDGEPAPRVEVVKKVAAEFIASRRNDRIGIVVFGDRAFVQCPLTLDQNILANLLQGIHLGIAGDATAIGDAIGIAVSHMKDIKAKSKLIILLTDGQNNSGMLAPQTAAEIAKTFGIKIYTIGVGVEGEAPFLVDTPFGKRVIYQKADLDEPTLKEIASITGGLFYRAKDSETLAKIYKDIDRLEKSEVKVKQYDEYNELFLYFALPGLFLLLTEIVLSFTVLRKVP